jgi:hypothetical protein
MPAPEPPVLVPASEPVSPPRPMSLVDSPTASVWPRPAGSASPRHRAQSELVSIMPPLVSFPLRPQVQVSWPTCAQRVLLRPSALRCLATTASPWRLPLPLTSCSQRLRPPVHRCVSVDLRALNRCQIPSMDISPHPSMTHDTLVHGSPNRNEALGTRCGARDIPALCEPNSPRDIRRARRLLMGKGNPAHHASPSARALARFLGQNLWLWRVFSEYLGFGPRL